jgi:hypothetical protein
MTEYTYIRINSHLEAARKKRVESAQRKHGFLLSQLTKEMELEGGKRKQAALNDIRTDMTVIISQTKDQIQVQATLYSNQNIYSCMLFCVGSCCCTQSQESVLG